MHNLSKLLLIALTGVLIMLAGCSDGENSSKLDLDTLQHEAARDDIRMPSADGKVVFSGGGVTIDASNTDQGYIMAKAGGGDTLKMRFEANGDTYTYDLEQSGEYVTFPLPMGSGTYSVKVLKQVSGTMYTPVLSKSLSVNLEDEMLPYLYPSQIVGYDPDSLCVKASFALSEDSSSEKDNVETLYGYVKDNISYDEKKAESVQPDYIPHPDETLKSSEGICYDYSSLLAAFLRVQNVPTKVMIGYVSDDDELHAWNMVYIGGEWMWYDATWGEKHKGAKDFTEDREY